MMRWLVLLAMFAGLLALAACAAKEEAPASPAPTTTAKPAWEQEWAQLLEAAKKEGKVAVLGPSGADARKALVDSFQKKYGIEVEYLGAAASELVTRIRTEREAGQYLWDVYIHGTSPAVPALTKGVKAFDPLEPALILPEAKELKSWRGGKLEFAEKERQYFVMSLFNRGTLFVNPNLVKPEEFKSYKDILDPKWKGKILIQDPRVAGPGQATFTFFYRHPELGPDFIRALGRQEPTITRDYRQQVEWVGQGRFPLLIGTADFTVEEMAKQGVPIAVVPPPQLKEGSDVSPANGAVAIFNRPAHPNAAKVYVNWLLTKEAQTEHARAFGYVSRRADVPTDHLPAWRVPKEGAIETYSEEMQDFKDKTVIHFVKEVFGP